MTPIIEYHPFTFYEWCTNTGGYYEREFVVELPVIVGWYR